MYDLILARRLRRAWAALDQGDHRPLLQSFAPQVHYENVAADHLFGGTYTTRAELAAHLERLFELLPGLRLTVRDVLVRGWAGNASAIVRVKLRADLPDGTAYENDLVQHMRLRWGKATTVRAMVDNVRARQAAARLVASGHGQEPKGSEACTG